MPSWKTEEEAEELARVILKPIDHEAFAALVSDKRFTFYTSLADRLGAPVLASMVEYLIFHPNVGPESNDDFLYHIVKFEGLTFFAFGVPEKFEARVEEFATAIHMRIGKGYPTMLGVDEKGEVSPTYFPGYKESEIGRYNLYTIENTSGSIAYQNRRDLQEMIQKREADVIDALMKYGYQIPLTMICDHLWGVNEARTIQ